MPESLRSYLARQSPPITVQEGKSMTNTKNRGFIAPISIKLWKDFDLEILNKMYGEILQFERDRRIPTLDSFPRIVWNEEGMKSYHHDWNEKIVCQGLKDVQLLLGIQERLLMVEGSSAQAVRGPNRPWRPDWAGVRRSRQNIFQTKASPEVNFLPGDTKVSTKWRFYENFQNGTIQEGPTEFSGKGRPEWFKPLAQIFSYCCRLKVRYGYIISDKELLVVRIGPNPDSPRNRGPQSTNLEIRQTEENGLLEFATVQLADDIDRGEKTSSSSVEEFPINLALWWLHLLAAKDNSVQFEYGPLADEVLPDLTDIPVDSGVSVDSRNESQTTVSIGEDDSAVPDNTRSVDNSVLTSFDVTRRSVSFDVMKEGRASRSKLGKRKR